MWGVFAKIFSKGFSGGDTEEAQGGESRGIAEMDRGDASRRPDADSHISLDSRQAKQRASVKWLLSKAFNNKVPENLKEPFYRDHENQEHLKPQIVGALANAEIYCLALGNIYSDPNYHNLNHSAILQTLSRKGVFVAEPSDARLTETTLIQTNPLRMTAHMAVVESIMTLYAKEVVTADRVMAAIQRFSHGRVQPPPAPDTHESGLLIWVNHTNEALMKRIEQDMDNGRITNGDANGTTTTKPKPVNIPAVRDLKDLCDGVALAGLISYYCPDELPWTELRISSLPTVSESLHNLGLVQDFCSRCLPASVFHMLPEDITYIRVAMKQNIIVFLADLFNLLEIHPVKCVRYPGMDKASTEGFPPRNAHGVAHKRNLQPTVMTPIPDLRSGLDDPVASQVFQVTRTPTHTPLRKTNSLQHSVSEMSEDSLRRGPEDSFVVHRGKNIPTLSSIIISDEPLAPARVRNKETMNTDTKADERGDSMAAGRPSNWKDGKKTFAGRRSRRNSTSDDSQLTIENFGGSQDNLNFIGRNPDKEVAVHSGRKISAPAAPESFSNPAVRSTLQDARGSIQLGYDNDCEKHETEQENHKLKRQLSNDEIAIRSIMQERNKENILQDLVDGELNNRLSFADLTKKPAVGDGGIQLVYMQQEKDGYPSKSSFLNKAGTTNGSEKKTTTFATLPNTTTWQQQSTNHRQQPDNAMVEDGRTGHVESSQLSDIRMQLEEKRRRIENEKRRMEVAMNKQRQKVGKAAFLQAVVKGKGGLVKSSSDAMVDSLMAGGGELTVPVTAAAATSADTASAAVKPAKPLTLKDISDDVTGVDRRWIDDTQPFVETRRTPDMENMDLETYQMSMANINSSLHDIQAEMQLLASQQNQVHQQMLFQQQKQHQQQQLHHQNYQPIPYPQQQSYNPQFDHGPVYHHPLQSSASAPHIPQSLYQQSRIVPEPQFFLHQNDSAPSTPPVAPQRRTWAQQAQVSPQPPIDTYHQPELRTWSKPQNPGGFLLHETNSDRYQDNRYHNGGGDTGSNHSGGSSTTGGFSLSQQHHLYGGSHHSTPSTSPQHRQHRQISQLLENKRASPVSLQDMEPVRPERKTSIVHGPIPAPSADDMEPQSISFIVDNDDYLSEGLSRLNITSGSRTYRIPSPTRPTITRTSFQQPTVVSHEREQQQPTTAEVSSLDNYTDPNSQKGFYISFDDEQPKRPKPPLRMKKGGSPKKERSQVEDDERDREREEREAQEKLGRKKQLERELELLERQKKEMEENEMREQLVRHKRETTSQERDKVNAASAIVIGNDLNNPDPDVVDERERKKKKILMMSLQRRTQQEESKSRKEAEAQAWREKEKNKEEEKLRKKEEQAARRQSILEQHKLKKALEEAEREGKDVDRSLLNSMKPVPKLRPKGSTARPRPKTIHIDSGSVEMAEGMLHPARGKKGSNTNLTANTYSASTMKRDYYRGSQDSLASSGLLYKDSPDDSRGMSPCHSANQTLGRRSSYKTSRDPSPAQARGRPKYSTYQNFKGRKSNSMMNLYGSSTDQDSLAYRYGDTDSGLGRATPPRRAPSPGMGPVRHLPSPSGPGSLPGLMSKRRVFDDGSSDISSTPSSMMDYNGPRLYKQPSSKSNRGIMLNAVEYCVFPGVVNREAKQRVLEEIARSESKHFLILFRDAGCQFRALYSYCPDKEEVAKLYGTGPKQVNDRMFDKFFKYNSGGKCFAQVHTKHLTVTIDAFTIHNSLWQGKKVNLPSKKDMALVI